MTNRIDFAVVFSVDRANPNGDPIDGNRPRQLSDGRGEVTDVCLKRKIRNRLEELGETILIKSADKCTKHWPDPTDASKMIPEPSTVADRYQYSVNNGKALKGLTEEDIEKGLKAFIDVRLFGQVYAFVDKSNGEHTRGAVSITSAISACPIEINETQITKSISNTEKDKKGSDTMGMKYNVPFGVYQFFGSVSGRIAEENFVTQADLDLLKKALCTLFQNDASTARPYGSMNIERVVWYEHDSVDGQVRPDEVKAALNVKPKDGVDNPTCLNDYVFVIRELPGLKIEVIDKPW